MNSIVKWGAAAAAVMGFAASASPAQAQWQITFGVGRPAVQVRPPVPTPPAAPSYFLGVVGR